MDFLYDLFFNFVYTMGLSWYLFVLLKSLVFIIITFCLIYILDAIQLIKPDENFDFSTNVELVRIRSCVITLIFLNTFWFFFIKLNGLIRFNWQQFIFDNTNVYLSIMPIFLSILLVCFLYTNSIKKLKV